MKSIGLMGPSYCGSTMMGCILGSLPGVAYVGESHRILKGDYGSCRCGDPDCSVFDYQISLEDGWWAALSRILCADVIVSGDKTAENFRTLGAPDQVVILIRDPRAWVVSHLHYKQMAEQNRDLQRAEVDLSNLEDLVRSAKLWLWHYGSCAKFCKDAGIPYINTTVDALCRHPEVSLRSLCDWLGLTYDAEALHFERKTHHHVGGNAQVGMKRIVGHRPRFHSEARANKGGYPKVDTTWKDILSPAQQDLILEVCNVSWKHDYRQG